MPHFVMDCAAEILELQSELTVLREIHKTAFNSGLFAEGDIKVRINPYQTYLVGNQKQPFIHVFSHIMQGRTTEQKADLAQAIVKTLNNLFPDIKNIAVNVHDFEKSTYFNKKQLGAFS